MARSKKVIPRPKQRLFGPHFLREWRDKSGMTLEQVGEAVGMSHAQLGRIERRLQKYNQELLEKLADLYGTTPASLIMRNPATDGIWSLWDQAHEAERLDIQRFAEYTINKRRTGT